MWFCQLLNIYINKPNIFRKKSSSCPHLIVLNKSYVQVSVCCLLGMFNTYFGFGADWLGFDLVIFAFGNS